MVQDKSESLDELIASHTPEAIRAKLAESSGQGYLRDFIFAAIDGPITTFAIVSGVAGARRSSGFVAVLEFATLIGDDFRMAVGNHQATRAEQQLLSRAQVIKKKQIDLYPAGERENRRRILSKERFEGAELDQVVRVITSDEKRWIDTLLQEELGMTLAELTPLRTAIVTFFAFIVAGLFPLMGFVLALAAPDLITRPSINSIVMTAIAFFTVGAAKSRFVRTSWSWSALETLVVGGGSRWAFLSGWHAVTWPYLAIDRSGEFHRMTPNDTEQHQAQNRVTPGC